jgi:hypothetical protein
MRTRLFLIKGLNAKALSDGWIYEPVVIAFNPNGGW